MYRTNDMPTNMHESATHIPTRAPFERHPISSRCVLKCSVTTRCGALSVPPHTNATPVMSARDTTGRQYASSSPWRQPRNTRGSSTQRSSAARTCKARGSTRSREHFPSVRFSLLSRVRCAGEAADERSGQPRAHVCVRKALRWVQPRPPGRHESEGGQQRRWARYQVAWQSQL